MAGEFPLTYGWYLIDRESTFGGVKITVALRLQIYTMHKTYFTARVPLSVVPDGGRLVD